MFPQEAFVIFAGILGAVVGSFLSVLAERLPTRGDVIWRRSYCPRCGVTLRFYELIPLVSFLLQRGRCRRCTRRISWRYPFFEALTAGLFALSVWRCTGGFTRCFWDLPVVVWWFFFGAMLLIAVIDHAELSIPEAVLYAAGLVGIGARVLFTPHALGSMLAGALFGGGFFWLLVMVSKERWMGMGDAELGAVVGIFLGFPAIGLALFVTCLLGGISALVLLTLGRKRFGDRLAFAPFLVAGGILTVFLWPWVPSLARVFLL